MDDKEKIRILKNSLARIDFFIDQAAQKYLDDIPPVRMTFKNFMDLLIVSVRKKEREAIRKEMTEAIVRKKIDAVINEKVKDLVRERAEKSFFVPVLLAPVTEEKAVNKWKAICVKGSIKQTRGPTPEAAYDLLKERMLGEMSDGPVGFLMHKLNGSAYNRFIDAKPYLEENFLGVRVRVRMEDEKKKEKGQKEEETGTS